MRQILLLSNSTLHGSEYLEWPRPYLRELLGDRPEELAPGARLDQLIQE